MKTINPDLLEEIVRRLVAEFQPEQIILFGSHAWGTPDEDSDLDLLVIVSESELRPVQRDAQAERCMRGLLVPTDILVKTRAALSSLNGIRKVTDRPLLNVLNSKDF
ncbi:MAG: nucleotidyltransferase domain-containing protein, partial [Anaerolineae bacterium]|nr:nucleotidyltransferase domain-containing protein [Anaerolineae bacterium]